MHINFLWRWLVLGLLVGCSPVTSLLHPSSPCPSVFSYDGAGPETDRWYGEIVVNSAEYLVGVRLNIQLDRQSHLMVSWLGEVTTSNNKEFTILNLEQVLDPSRPMTTRIMVRFEPNGGSPKVKTIWLNGKQICPAETPKPGGYSKPQQRPQKPPRKKGQTESVDNTYTIPSSNTEYNAGQNEQSSYNQDAYGSNGRPQTVTNSETSHARPQKSPESSYNTRPQTNSDSNYNSRPQTNPDNVYYVKPQTETSYNTRPQTNPEPSYNTRPQSNSDSNYNSRPQTNPEPSYDTRPQSSPDTSYNTRPQSSPDTSYNTRPQSNSDTTYNTRPQSNSDTRPQTTSDSNYNSRPQTNPEPSYTKPQTNYQNNYDTMPSAGNSYTGNRPQTISESSYNTKPQQTYEESYRPQGNVGGSGGYQSGNVGYNSNTGYNTQPQPTVNTGYSTSSSNSRPVVYQGQKPSSQSEISYNGKKPSQNSNTPDIGDIAEHLIDDGDSNNKTVIITVIKHNAQETTTENYKTTTWKAKTTGKPNNKDKDRDNRDKDKDNNSGNKGHPLNTQHSQKRPAESNNKNTNNNNNNNNGQSSGNSNKDVSCGTVVYNKAQPLVTYGQKTARGQWPWHVALYRTEGINLSYVCGGSLVSVNYVITAAHCVTKKPYDKPVDSDTLVIYLGKYHQHQFSDEGGVQNKQVKRVHIYPTFNSSNYLGDIALLQLSSDVDYSMYVRPVCLWDDSTAPLQLSAVEGRDGTVIGWGYDENDRVSEELKMAIMPIVSHQQCLWSNPQFFSQFTSDETFCAGFRNGTSVCNGDSGGGMVFKIDSAWYLRGIVSITVARDGLRVCDTKHYVVFTDVAKYLGWIRPILASGSR
ncbi:hypothetical protein M8J75_006418 [Diaphorina citri]|nr:hypothetical protein M8J75_006418 [Diaphorina citri]